MEQLNAISAQTFGMSMCGPFERFSAIIFHIALPTIVFKAAQSRKHTYLYPCAILIRALVDLTIVFYAQGTLPFPHDKPISKPSVSLGTEGVFHLSDAIIPAIIRSWSVVILKFSGSPRTMCMG